MSSKGVGVFTLFASATFAKEGSSAAVWSLPVLLVVLLTALVPGREGAGEALPDLEPSRPGLEASDLWIYDDAVLPTGMGGHLAAYEEASSGSSGLSATHISQHQTGYRHLLGGRLPRSCCSLPQRLFLAHSALLL